MLLASCISSQKTAQTGSPGIDVQSMNPIFPKSKIIPFGKHFSFEEFDGWCASDEKYDDKGRMTVNLGDIDCQKADLILPDISISIIDMGKNYKKEADIIEEWVLYGEETGFGLERIFSLTEKTNTFIGDNKVYTTFTEFTLPVSGNKTVFLFNVFKIDGNYFCIMSSPVASYYIPEDYPYLYKQTMNFIKTIVIPT